MSPPNILIKKRKEESHSYKYVTCTWHKKVNGQFSHSQENENIRSFCSTYSFWYTPVTLSILENMIGWDHNSSLIYRTPPVAVSEKANFHDILDKFLRNPENNLKPYSKILGFRTLKVTSNCSDGYLSKTIVEIFNVSRKQTSLPAYNFHVNVIEFMGGFLALICNKT